MLMALSGNFLSQRVWVTKAIDGELVKWRIGIRGAFFVDRHLQNTFPNAYLRASGERGNEQQQKLKLPSHRFHLGRQTLYRACMSSEKPAIIHPEVPLETLRYHKVFALLERRWLPVVIFQA